MDNRAVTEVTTTPTQQNTQYDLHKSLHKYKYNFINTEIHPNIFADVRIKKNIDNFVEMNVTEYKNINTQKEINIKKESRKFY